MAQTSSARSVREQQPYNGLFLVKPGQDGALPRTPVRTARRGRDLAREPEPNLLILAAAAMALPGVWAAEKLLHLLLHHS